MARSSRSRQGGQALILIFLGSLLLGGSSAGFGLIQGGRSVHDLQKDVKTLIPQEDRRRRIDAILDRWQDQAKSFDRSRSRFGKDFFALMHRHDASRPEFDRLIGEVDSVNSESRRTLLDLRHELRDSMTADEWRAVFRPPAANQSR